MFMQHERQKGYSAVLKLVSNVDNEQSGQCHSQTSPLTFASLTPPPPPHTPGKLGGITFKRHRRRLPNFQKSIKFKKPVFFNHSNKKKLLFFSCQNCQVSLDEEFLCYCGYWDKDNMEEHLRYKGIYSRLVSAAAMDREAGGQSHSKRHPAETQREVTPLSGARCHCAWPVLSSTF